MWGNGLHNKCTFLWRFLFRNKLQIDVKFEWIEFMVALIQNKRNWKTD